MVPLKDTVCTLEQAQFFAQKGMVQHSRYGWEKNPESGLFEFVFDAPNGYPEIVDWSETPDSYAAFDNSDLGIILASLGYYPAGPTFRLPGDTEQYRWWCDDIQTFTSVEDTIYQGYGRTEAEAKGMMLKKLVEKGIPPIGWLYYKNRLQEIDDAVEEMKRNKPNQNS